MDNEDEGARLTRREENRELIAKHRATVEPRGCPTPGSCSAVAERKKVMTAHMLAASIVERATVATPRTDAATVRMERLDGDIDEVVSADFARTLERELIDIKQRLLPQFSGRAQRAEHERDALLEKLIVRQTTIANLHDVIDGMRGAARSATAATDFFNFLESAAQDIDYNPEGGGELSGVEAVLEFLREPLVYEVLNRKAAPVEAGATDRPDWAQQLPGAEIFDRSNDAGEKP